MILIQSMQRDVLWIQLKLKRSFFKKTEVFVENDKEQFTISDLVRKMQEYLHRGNLGNSLTMLYT